MKWRYFLLSGPFFVSLTSNAAKFPAMVGDWTLLEMEGPTRLAEVYYNFETEASRVSFDSTATPGANEWIVDAIYPIPFLTMSRQFALTGSGDVVGEENGRVIDFLDSRILYQSGEDISVAFPNVTGDLFMTSAMDDTSLEMTLGVRHPATLEVAELSGDWTVTQMTNPVNLTTHLFGGRLADSFFEGESSVIAVPIVIGGDGGFGGAFTGNLVVNSPGSIQVITDDTNFRLFPNGSKDVMIGAVTDDIEHGYTVVTRPPLNLSVGDLEGVWRLCRTSFPNKLIEFYENSGTGNVRQLDSDEVAGPNEFLIDVLQPEKAYVERAQLVVEADGTVAGGGALSPQVDRTVDLNYGGRTFDLAINRSKNFMVGVSTSANSQELIALIKVSESPARSFDESVALKMIKTTSGAVFLNWTGESETELQELNAEGVWVAVPEGEGQDLLSANDGRSLRLFRVATKEP